MAKAKDLEEALTNIETKLGGSEKPHMDLGEHLEYIESLIGGGSGGGNVDDVKVNGTSVVEDKTADIKLKTINNEAITGAGNIDIQSGGPQLYLNTFHFSNISVPKLSGSFSTFSFSYISSVSLSGTASAKRDQMRNDLLRLGYSYLDNCIRNVNPVFVKINEEWKPVVGIYITDGNFKRETLVYDNGDQTFGTVDINSFGSMGGSSRPL